MYENWQRVHLPNDKPLLMAELFEKDRPTFGGFDTETTGLHIIRDTPFLIVFGWMIPGTEDDGRVFTFHPTTENMKTFFKLAQRLKAFIAHNVKYDLHMLKNIDWEYLYSNIVETMALARLCVEAVPARAGGDSLKLKDLGDKYVHPEASAAEDRIKELKKKIKADRTKVLVAALKQFDHPTDTETKPFRLDNGKKTTTTFIKKNPDKAEWRTVPAKWNKQRVEDFLKDITNTIDDLPSDVREVWEDWQKEYGIEVTYKDIYDRYPEEMRRYAQDDVITMLLFAKKAYLVIAKRNQMKVLERESKIIYPLYRMERVGIKVNQDKLQEGKQRLRSYILKKREEMYDICQAVVNVGQHEAIKERFYRLWKIALVKSDKPALKKVIEQHPDTDAAKYASLIIELRTLEKWYSTYCVRLIDITSYDGRFYTQISQCSAVSGRVGSDGQQFPKKPIKDDEGNIIYFPREVFEPTGNGYDHIYYLDFSQIELRTQANYTILVSGGDPNLCRAYMPFKCTHYLTGEEYNYKDVEQRKRWNELKEGHPDPADFEEGITDVLNEGWSTWLLEDGTPWKPTDVHSETTHNALIELGYECLEKYHHYEHSDPNESFYRSATKDRQQLEKIVIDTTVFKDLRNKGKVFNFMKNYGGGKGAAMEQLDLSEEVALALIRGYETAFPHVVIYQNKIVEQLRKKGYVQNMYGRRYYLNDVNKGYKLGNYCVQGTDADLLKECIIAIDAFLADKKSRFQMNIHDELSFEVYNGEEWIIPHIKAIMEKHDWHLVPIVSDIERTSTNWASKESVAS